MTNTDVDITSPVHKSDPHPFYAPLRAEAPVRRVALPDGQSARFVTRFDEVEVDPKDRRLVLVKARMRFEGP